MQLINKMKYTPEVYAEAMMYVCTYAYVTLNREGGAYSLTHTVPFHSDITLRQQKSELKKEYSSVYVRMYLNFKCI